MNWEYLKRFSLTKNIKNNLLKILEKINKADRLQTAKLISTKNGQIFQYKKTVYQERLSRVKKDLASQDY